MEQCVIEKAKRLDIEVVRPKARNEQAGRTGTTDPRPVAHGRNENSISSLNKSDQFRYKTAGDNDRSQVLDRHEFHPSAPIVSGGPRRVGARKPSGGPPRSRAMDIDVADKLDVLNQDIVEAVPAKGRRNSGPEQSNPSHRRTSDISGGGGRQHRSKSRERYAELSKQVDAEMDMERSHNVGVLHGEPRSHRPRRRSSIDNSGGVRQHRSKSLDRSNDLSRQIDAEMARESGQEARRGSGSQQGVPVDRNSININPGSRSKTGGERDVRELLALAISKSELERGRDSRGGDMRSQLPKSVRAPSHRRSMSLEKLMAFAAATDTPGIDVEVATERGARRQQRSKSGDHLAASCTGHDSMNSRGIGAEVATERGGVRKQRSKSLDKSTYLSDQINAEMAGERGKGGRRSSESHLAAPSGHDSMNSAGSGHRHRSKSRERCNELGEQIDGELGSTEAHNYIIMDGREPRTRRPGRRKSSFLSGGDLQHGRSKSLDRSSELSKHIDAELNGQVDAQLQVKIHTIPVQGDSRPDRPRCRSSIDNNGSGGGRQHRSKSRERYTELSKEVDAELDMERSLNVHEMQGGPRSHRTRRRSSIDNNGSGGGRQHRSKSRERYTELSKEVDAELDMARSLNIDELQSRELRPDRPRRRSSIDNSGGGRQHRSKSRERYTELSKQVDAELDMERSLNIDEMQGREPQPDRPRRRSSIDNSGNGRQHRSKSRERYTELSKQVDAEMARESGQEGRRGSGSQEGTLSGRRSINVVAGKRSKSRERDASELMALASSRSSEVERQHKRDSHRDPRGGQQHRSIHRSSIDNDATLLRVGAPTPGTDRSFLDPIKSGPSKKERGGGLKSLLGKKT